jgi:outer membrane protein assembly factor BamB
MGRLSREANRSRSTVLRVTSDLKAAAVRLAFSVALACTGFYFSTGNATPPGPTAVPYGGGIWGWGGLATDPQTQNLFGGTSNVGGNENAVYSDSIIEFNSTLTGGPLATILPDPAVLHDTDFGGSIAIYTDPADNSPCLVGLRKDGLLFSMNRTNIALTPAAALQVSSPQFENVGTPAFSSASGLIYLQNQSTNGIYQQGMIALRPGPGCTINPTPVWQYPMHVLVAPESIAGQVVYGIGLAVYAFNAQTGALLWTSPQGVATGAIQGGLYQAPTIVNGELFVDSAFNGGIGDSIYAYGL